MQDMTHSTKKPGGKSSCNLCSDKTPTNQIKTMTIHGAKVGLNKNCKNKSLDTISEMECKHHFAVSNVRLQQNNHPTY